MEKLTALQWVKRGFVPNEDAKGEEGWNNNFYRYRVIRFSESEVHEDLVAAKAIVSAKNKEYREEAKKREQKRKGAYKHRQKMKTKWQWLQEGRIPDEDARWEVGRDLNKYSSSPFPYGSDYCYCHKRHTHKPKDDEEMQEAIEDYRRNGNSWV